MLLANIAELHGAHPFMVQEAKLLPILASIVMGQSTVSCFAEKDSVIANAMLKEMQSRIRLENVYLSMHQK